ncbi:hypothetical protein ACFFJT_20625 [Dyella flava]|uniref:Uncharacterized protein n=1 Tax=Dyella flava TaxID=1920170 RepID=A0ABS2JYQ4_9GAMM|nr:hypothetical protein [Dyella flava]MBM7123769.1 hypothetical protein [Dyella flava]GLQ52633.1 hypothetical protein GCM10010872_40820 [Dyella flava]
MDFEEMNNFMSTYKTENQDIRFRIRKRGLESKERRLLGTVSSVYGFYLFLFAWGALAPFLDRTSAHFAITAMAGGSAFVVLIFGYIIYRVWRNPPPSAAVMAIPGLLIFLLGLPNLSLMLCIPSAFALVAFYYLGKTWKELAAMSAPPSDT